MVVGTLAWLALSRGKVRVVLKTNVFAGLAIAVAGFGFFVFTGSSDMLILLSAR